MSKLHYCMRVDVIGGKRGVKNNVYWTLSVAMVEFRLSPKKVHLCVALGEKICIEVCLEIKCGTCEL